MTKSIGSPRRRWLTATCAAAVLSLAAGAAHAQLSTSSVQGRLAEAGAGASVTARDIDTGFVTRTTTTAGGSFVIPGLKPGRYQITVTEAGGKTRVQTVELLVGQTATVEFEAAAAGGEVTVTARRAVEVKTSEVATNVSRDQIENLPQSDRNFINFATLSPGVRMSSDPQRKVFSAGANGANAESLTSSQVNVFIDGVSLKSDIQQGGIVGQDSSRGNPFSQLAVQEFRVSTENFKAEYEQAGTSIITAVTKSGTNEFHGEVFGLFQNKAMISKDFIERQQGLAKPDLDKKQYGVSLGGPIIKDKLQFFVAYEANDQRRTFDVVAGGSPAVQATLPFNVHTFEGAFPSTFHEDLLFGKLTWQVSDAQTVEASASYRRESELRNGGGQSSAQQDQNIRNSVTTWRVEDRLRGDGWLNEATVDYLDSTFNPAIANPSLVGQNFFGVIQIGGYSTAQKVNQRDLTFRDNVTFDRFDWHGSHTFKVGAKVSAQRYQVQSAQDSNPQFNYNIDPANNEDFSQPFEAVYGTGVPHVSANNIQVGLFAQDDWHITSQWTLNLGLRWDYETNANNNNYVTPPAAVAAMQSLAASQAGSPGVFFNPSDYISTGSNRKPFAGEFQPRVGISYDVFDDQKTVLFAGAGRYYDRTLFRNAAEESLFRQFTLRSFEFSKDGLPRNGQPTILWNPSYLSKAGLDGLIASNLAPNGELRVIKNDQPPPFTD